MKNENELTDEQGLSVDVVPKQTFINRLAEKDRKHEKEKSELHARIAELESMPKQNSYKDSNQELANQAAKNVIDSGQQAEANSIGQTNIMDNAKSMQQEQNSGYANYQQQQSQQQFNAPTQQHQQQQQPEIDPYYLSMQNNLEQGRNKVLKSISDAAANDVDFKNLLTQKGNQVPDDIASLLIGEPDAHLVVKKLMENPEHLTSYHTAMLDIGNGIKKADPVKRAEILNKISKEVQGEKNASQSPGEISSQIRTRGGMSSKDPDSMSASEYRRYQLQKNNYKK